MLKVSRKTMAILLIILLVSALSGCTKDPKKQQAVTETSPTPQVEQKTPVPDDLKGEISVVTLYKENVKNLEQAAKDYMALHANVTVNVKQMPYDGYGAWLKTQYLTDQAPEVVFTEGANEFKTTDNIISLNDFLNEPNPYSKSGKAAWKDDFVNPYIELSKDAGGSVNMIPWSLYGIGMYYNKTLFDKAGVIELPKTWNEFMDVSGKLKATGVTPWAVALKPSDAQTAWPLFIMHAATTRSLVPEVNLLHKDNWSFDSNNPLSVQGETITAEERYVAFKKGLIDPVKSKQMADPYRIMKEAAKFMNTKNFTAIEGADAINDFLNGKSAMLYQGTWYLPTLQSKLAEFKKSGKNDKAFEFGIFPFPEITMENTDTLALGGVNQSAGLRNGFMVKKMKDDNKTKIAIDFLKFITSPEQADKLFKMEDPATGFRYITDISTVQGVAPMPGTEQMQPKQQWADLTAGGVNYDQKDWDEFWIQWQQYFTDKITFEEFLKQRSKSNLAALERNLKTFDKDIDKVWMEKQLKDIK